MIKLLLLLTLVFVSCTDEESDLVSIICDDQTFVYECQNDEAQINVCLSCSLCQEDNRLNDINYVSFYIESFPDRCSVRSDFYQFDEQMNVSFPICASIIDEEYELSISVLFRKTPDFNHAYEYGIFDKINVRSGAIVNYNKKIENSDLWGKEECTIPSYYGTMNRPPDPNKEYELVNVSLVGSFQDCFGSMYTIKELSNFDSLVIEAAEFFHLYYEAVPYSSTCGEIYFELYD